jgi:phosphotransferase system enzyme I (PtsI)
VDVFCNIASPEDVPAVLANDGHGIGLFRSEFLFLNAARCPDEQAQFQAYRQVAAAMEGRPVTIRTLDIGGDKQAPCLELAPEENPALGLRGIRVCLERPDLFFPQLRAIYRASAFGCVSILFPMITSLWEVRACKDACRQVMDDLSREGIPYDPNTRLGIMIETPACALIADDLAREVDFFCLGTNDLTQYTLACDRQRGDLNRFCDPHHPAVLRCVQLAADAAHRAGIRVGICGELAADLTLLPTFLSLGIDELSVPPAAVLPLRAAIRETLSTQQPLPR